METSYENLVDAAHEMNHLINQSRSTNLEEDPKSQPKLLWTVLTVPQPLLLTDCPADIYTIIYKYGYVILFFSLHLEIQTQDSHVQKS